MILTDVFEKFFEKKASLSPVRFNRIGDGEVFFLLYFFTNRFNSRPRTIGDNTHFVCFKIILSFLQKKVN